MDNDKALRAAIWYGHTCSFLRELREELFKEHAAIVRLEHLINQAEEQCDAAREALLEAVKHEEG